jgi:hypothetical protein
MVLTRSPNVNSVLMNPLLGATYSARFTNNYPSECPILRYKLLDNAGNVLSYPNVYIINQDTPSTARIDVKNGIPFTITVRIQAFTMQQNNYLTQLIRVCGEETIALTSATRKFHLLGFSRGDPAVMTDDARYMSITEATFQTYFAVSPNGDPCSIMDYALYESVSPLIPWTSPKVTLVGTKGSYVFKIDKTIASDLTKVWIRAITRGLNTVNQPIEFVVCPASGGVSVVKPSPTSPTVWNATGGTTITLPP